VHLVGFIIRIQLLSGEGSMCHTSLLTARELSANLCDMYHCCVYSEKLLMMDRGTFRNM